MITSVVFTEEAEEKLKQYMAETGCSRNKAVNQMIIGSTLSVFTEKDRMMLRKLYRKDFPTTNAEQVKKKPQADTEYYMPENLG